MIPEHVDLIRSLSAPSVHPDGDRCAVAVTRPDLRSDSTVGQIWEVPLAGGEPRLLTRGFRDTAPQYSPDGRFLAFLRAEAGGKPQVAVADARGGEPLILTAAPLGVAQFTISPDGARIAYTARVPEEGRYGSIEGVGPGAEDPRLIKDLNYRMNGVGYTGDQRLRLFVLDVPPLDTEPFIPARGRAAKAEAEEAAATDSKASQGLPESRELTDGAVDHAEPRFSADGTWIYTVSRFDPAAVDTLGSRAVRTPAEGGPSEPLELGADAASVQAVAEDADGTGVFGVASSLGSSGRDFIGRSTHLFWHTSGDGTTVRLSTEADDLGEAPAALHVDSAGRALVLSRSRGAVQLLAFTPDGHREELTRAPLVVTGVGEARGAVVLAAADAEGPGELYRLAPGDVLLEPLTDINAPLRSAAAPLVPRELAGTSPDGSDVHGWVVLPEGDGPHPALLMIHGGPFAQYTGAWFDEAQVLAGAGYAVVMCNPRGAAGYGEEHGRAIVGRMGTVDYEDVIGFLDAALAAYPQLDRDRLGILGGSYGGYLTAWTIAHDHRFKAAVVERGFLDPLSFVGSSDIGWYFPGEYTGWDAEAMLAQSPMACVAEVRTPTLVVHSEEDWRCPIEQAQRYYAALRLGGVETELLIFPGENHELSRSGTPHHRRTRFEHILRWLGQHL
ncbi:dipeptidyl aminopeptidase [Sinomonas cellulolyticus]|uniref:S9 family peptidase n=1 Tax=Sinomonas cellulolyticus TaxID=2801916 RepID=A0ABS1K1A8_9MICC|nr:MULTISPECIES: S9 family peptidase [Sinomonas]MBL0705263.1 S9 family peptidase [Sinomonas cellulolyticus]GHG40203.1 dipeptidyl aminopeptidase [Sinomonas sp. KCTC 49339]